MLNKEEKKRIQAIEDKLDITDKSVGDRLNKAMIAEMQKIQQEEVDKSNKEKLDTVKRMVKSVLAESGVSDVIEKKYMGLLMDAFKQGESEGYHQRAAMDIGHFDRKSKEYIPPSLNDLFN